jgi:hypothetical protein
MVIIDAKKFGEGPVARLRMPTYVPFGVHGSWSERYVAGPPKEAELKAIAALKAAGGGTSLNGMQGPNAKIPTPGLSGGGGGGGSGGVDSAATQEVQDGVSAGIIAAGVTAAVLGAALLSSLA